MRATIAARQDAAGLAASVLCRMATDLSLVLDRELRIDAIEVERSLQRPAGTGQVHICFKLGIDLGGESRQGCVLVPLTEAMALAGYMMMLSDDEVTRERERFYLDDPLKEALLEVSRFLAGACDAVLRTALPERGSVRSEGCQGVRAEVRPALACREGESLLVARARARLHDYPSFEVILVLPELVTGEDISRS